MSVKAAETAARVHAFAEDALGEHDAVGLAGRIASGEVSREEVVEAAIARAERMQPPLNGLAYAAYPAARVRARAAGVGPCRTAYFSGVPSLVKDNVDVAGMPTGQGSAAFRARPTRTDGAFAAQYLAQGFVPLGKSRMPEFGFNASTEFAGAEPTRNPWHTAYSSGASSGGAAAFVAAGVVPVAHGNDGGGSIRIPAAACGLVGLKPTRGRLALDPTMRDLPVGLVCNGVLTRSVRDTAAFHREAERRRPAPGLPPVGDVRGPGRDRLRIGVLADSVTGHPTDRPTREAVLDLAALLEEQGHHVDEVASPVGPRFGDDFSLYWSLLGYVLLTTGRRAFGPTFDQARADNLSRGLKRMLQQNRRRLPGAVLRLRHTRRRVDEFFSRPSGSPGHDVLLSPTLGHTTPELGYLSPEQPFDRHLERLVRYVAFTPLQNASGHPAISLPTGVGAHGLPVGVHLGAGWGRERTLLEVAYEIEQARPWRRIQDESPARPAP